MSKKLESKFQSFLAAKSEVAESPQDRVIEIAVLKSGSQMRNAGKRSDPTYEQVTAYIRKSTHDAVKIALLKEGKRRQFSELVEELLSRWVRELE